MLLSVIVPVYNSEKYLADCIESVINQTYKMIELILVNDGSTDNSDHICKKYSKKYSNIKVFTIKNRGSGYARNYGLKHASGEYVAFIDSDDWLDPNMFKKLMMRNYNSKLDIVSCNLIHAKINGKKIKETSRNRYGFYNRDHIVREIFPVLINTKTLSQQEWPMRMVTKVYNMDFLTEYRIRFVDDLKAAQDFVFSVTAMYHARSFYYFENEYLYYYRENLESRTHKHLANSWNNYLVMNEYLHNLLMDSNEYNFTNQLELSKLHGVLSSISYVYREGNSNSFFEKYNYTKEFSSYYNLTEAVKLIDWKKVSLKKLIFSFLLEKKMYFIISLLANTYFLTVDRLYKIILKRRIRR